MNSSQVSIIVPCYNVENYIEKCIVSICNQTYKNIQIIIVEDGATDNTSEIIDRLALTDKRIQVLHKPNAGVSAARNSGIEIAKGEYIVFIDGDDYLATDYVEYMLSLAYKDNSDFVMSKNCYTKNLEPQIDLDNVITMTPTQATALLLSPGVIVGCWNKMFKREFVEQNNLKFSTTLFYGEGLSFITKASQKANSVTVGERKVYYYRRNNETSATSKFNILKYYNGEEALDKIQKECIIHDKQIDVMMSLHKSLFCLGALSQAYANNLQNVYSKDCQHWRSVIRKNFKIVLISSAIPFYRKVLLICGYLFPKLTSKLDIWRRKQIAKQSVK